MLNWGNRRTIPVIDDRYLVDEMLYKSTILYDLTTPIWSVNRNNLYRELPKNRIETLNGITEIKTLDKNVTYHSYIINVQNKSQLKENTFYYPGWSLYVNGKPYNFTYQDRRFPGVILFTLKEGLYFVELKLEQTVIRRTARTVSGITVILFSLASLYEIKRKKFIASSRKLPKK
jgi:hypothetical protein